MPPLLSLVSLARIVAAPASRSGPPAPSELDDEALAAYVAGVLRRLPAPWRRTCLRQSVVMYRLLRRAGRPVALCIGVRREGPVLSAHAWLLRDGAPYLEADPSHSARYSVIASFPSPPGT